MADGAGGGRPEDGAGAAVDDAAPRPAPSPLEDPLSPEAGRARLARSLRILTRCHDAILRAEGESALLAEICRILVEVGGYVMCWAGLALSDERRTIRPVASAGRDDGYLDAVDLVWADEERGRGPTGTAVREGRAVVGGDFATDPRLTRWRAAALARGYRSSTALPLACDGERIGVITMYAAEPRAFDDDEVVTLRRLAADVAFGVLAHRRRTEREAVDRDLREREEAFRTVFETNPESMTVIRASDGIFLAANEAFLRLLGWTPDEVLGRTALDFGLWDRPEDRARVLGALRAGGEVRDVETDFRARDGRLLRGLLSGRVIAVAGERRYLFAVRDLTARRRAEAERDALQRQLLEAQKLESIGRLAGGVAHDFNNLLTVVLSSAAALREDLAAGRAPALADVEAIQAAGERARDLTRQLLSFARRQVIAPEVVDLAPLLRASERLLARVLGEDLALRVELAEGLWPVRCDPAQLDQVIMNLAVNARDAMPRGGRLTIAAENLALDEGAARARPGASPGPHVALRVSDTGVGMSAEVRRRVFEPFFTTKPPGEGTGLGLATVHGLVRQMGGVIAFESEEGRGTSFEILLPRADGALAGPAAAPAPRPAGGGEAILLLEDDPQVRQVVARALEEAGYRLLVTGSAAEALAAEAAWGGALDLLLSDVILPDRPGPEVAAAIARRRPGLRVLFMSGYTGDAISRQGVLAPGVQLLQKPFTGGALLARVRAVLDAPAAAGE